MRTSLLIILLTVFLLPLSLNAQVDSEKSDRGQKSMQQQRGKKTNEDNAGNKANVNDSWILPKSSNVLIRIRTASLRLMNYPSEFEIG